MVSPYLPVAVGDNMGFQSIFIFKRDIVNVFRFEPSTGIAWFSVIGSQTNALDIVCFVPLFGATLNGIFLFGIFHLDTDTPFFTGIGSQRSVFDVNIKRGTVMKSHRIIFYLYTVDYADSFFP